MKSSNSWLKPGLLSLGAAALLVGGFGVARAAGLGRVLHHTYGAHGMHGGAMGHDFIEFRLAKALDKVDATEDQRKQIKAIVDAGFAKHQAMAARHEALHGQLLAALSGETVDRAAIEAARVEAISAIDQGSKDLAKSLGDIAEVLTPAQRAQLAHLHDKQVD
jgi:periplasmic protein CpxP/Spy